MIRRMTLAADTLTTVNRPSVAYREVLVGNATDDDLYVFSPDAVTGDETDRHVLVGSGMDRLIPLDGGASLKNVLKLKSTPGGEVVLIWGGID